MLILTHDHSDHTNGAERLLQKANVRHLYIPARDGGGDNIRKIIGVAQDRGTKVHAVDEDIRVPIYDMDVHIIYNNQIAKENELGLAALFQLRDFEMIVTGDLGEKTEALMIEEQDLPDAEVYVVGHHGSNESSSYSFLNTILPEYALISVGENNQYKHPGEKTLTRLKSMGIKVLRTDQSGTIRFSSNQVKAG